MSVNRRGGASVCTRDDRYLTTVWDPFVRRQEKRPAALVTRVHHGCASRRLLVLGIMIVDSHFLAKHLSSCLERRRLMKGFAPHVEHLECECQHGRDDVSALAVASKFVMPQHYPSGFCRSSRTCRPPSSLLARGFRCLHPGHGRFLHGSIRRLHGLTLELWSIRGCWTPLLVRLTAQAHFKSVSSSP